MSKFKGTPGPWQVKAGSWDHDGCVRYSLAGITDLKAADARLIAAAPDLLEALKDLTADISDRFDMNSPSTNPGIKFCIERAEAALAKALGQ